MPTIQPLIHDLGGDGSTLGELHGAVVRAELPPDATPAERGAQLAVEGNVSERRLRQRAEAILAAREPAKPARKPKQPAEPADDGDSDTE